METCSNFIPSRWKPKQCQNCFQLKENHLVTSLPIATPTSTAIAEPKPKPKPRRAPTLTETPTSAPIPIETPLATSAPASVEKTIVLPVDVDKSIEECTQRLKTISITSNDNQSDISLTTIIGVEIDTIPELKSLEVLLAELPKQSSNQTFLQFSVEALINIVTDLCKNNYSILKELDLKKRKMFIESIIDKIRPMQKLLVENLQSEKWKQLKKQLNLLNKLCKFDFSEKPLMFARQGLKYISDLRELEDELTGLIDKMRYEYPIILNDILHTEYTRIKKNRRAKIVISVLGSIKASKSSLINFLLEDEICPTGNQETTARLTKITYGERILLRSSSADLAQPRIFNNTKELLREAKKIINLNNQERKSELCNVEIVIKLPIEELKNVELWDVPGFDENPVLDVRIREILADTDLILVVIPPRGSLRQTDIDFITPCLKESDTMDDKRKLFTKICFIISQIDTYRPDVQTKQSRENFLQNMYTKIQQKLNIQFLDDDYRSSNQFIPMCSSHRHCLEDYLTCRKEFIKKSHQWFDNALREKAYRRSNILVKVIGTFWNYENVFRQQDRYELLKKILNDRYPMFKKNLKKHVTNALKDVYQSMNQVINEIVKDCVELYKTGESPEKIEEYVHNELMRKFSEFLYNAKPKMEQIISNILKNFSAAIELTAPQMRTLKEILDEIFSEDYCEGVATTYENTSPYHLFSYLKGMLYVLSNKLTASFRFDQGNHKMFGQRFICRQIYIERETLALLTTRLNDIAHFIYEDLNTKVENMLDQFLVEYLDQLDRKIEENVNKYIFSSPDNEKLDCIRKFYTDNSIQLRHLHLDALDIQFKLEYSVNINTNEKLNEHSNFNVYAGTLKPTESQIAAKLIKLKDFSIQEILYIRELKHPNVISYYGVKRKTKDQYYIIMPRLDCDLTAYLKQYYTSLTGHAIDQMITQIVKGLDYIHTDLELVHRDIKPQNILVNIAKTLFIISDLGGVHREPITCIHTEGYAAPELLSKQNPALITEKCDIYSLGIVIQQITGLFKKLNPHDKLMIKWAKISEKCCLPRPSERPNCKAILEMSSLPSEKLN